MLLVTPPSMYINLVRFLIWSAMRVAPCVRTCATCCAVFLAGGFCRLDERLRVCENAVEGAKRTRASKVIVIRFKVVSPLLLFSDRPHFFRWRDDCTKDQRGC